MLMAQTVHSCMAVIGCSDDGWSGGIDVTRNCMRRRRRSVADRDHGSFFERGRRMEGRREMLLAKATSPGCSSNQKDWTTEAKQESTRTWWFMILAYVVAIGLAIAIGPLSIGRDGDLAVASFMVVAACAVRRGDLVSKGEQVCCSWAGSFLGRTTSSSFPKVPPVCAHRWAMEWARTATRQVCPRGTQ